MKALIVACTALATLASPALAQHHGDMRVHEGFHGGGFHEQFRGDRERGWNMGWRWHRPHRVICAPWQYEEGICPFYPD